ncbi:MAG TPA: DUF554 family protein [Methylomirabilota bacterium]|nr:DUF554 family protein [Methylomirabilota bacterium]
MIGTFLNAGAILLGALVGLATKFEVSARRQQQIKVLLGVATAWLGLRLLWIGLASGSSSFSAKLFFGQFVVVLMAMVIGHAAGKACRGQALMNRIGQFAKSKLEGATARRGATWRGDGFIAATLLFCAAPLGIVGALQDGLSGYFYPLAVKAVMDGLAAFSFARMFGWTALLAAVPVAAFLSGWSLLGAGIAPWLAEQGLIGVVHASAGLIITYVALIIFEVKKVEIGNYLPALAVAPALMKLWQVML